MADLNRTTLRVLVIVYFCLLQLVIGYIATIFCFLQPGLFFRKSNSYIFASASSDHNPSKKSPSNSYNEEGNIVDRCNDCRTTSKSIEELLAQPRQMDAYGQVEDRIDLNKIKKAICKSITNDKTRERCRNFYFTHEADFVKWKESQTTSRASFFDFVCIKELKYCCPRGSFGPRCNRCIDCGPNEHCSGEGTRAGNGSCVCIEGYAGPKCASCSPGYFSHQSNDNVSTVGAHCKPCHRSCLFCRREGSLGCEVCRSGFTWIPAYGCSDIDECVQSKKVCGDNTFCVNTEGSYFCYECDRACDGCHGDGPDMCLGCAVGYKLDRGNCVALKKTILPPEANYYRYAIYAGLCICTSIILHNNIYLASLVGLGVALYIGVSEYIMSSHLLEMEQQSHGISANPQHLTS